MDNIEVTEKEIPTNQNDLKNENNPIEEKTDDWSVEIKELGLLFKN
ncbi:hypothetical protein [Psychroflexus montanilacus]|nr:hypothetical protein [Psychroflexus montanilacus]MBZ9650619.1 hypothetical protein [Psychroflexus montanilacus]